jgi:hypothetical protein
VRSWELPGPVSIDLTDEHRAAIMAAVALAEWREDTRATMWVGRAVAPVLGLDPDEDKEQLKGLIKKLIKEKVLKTLAARTADRKPCVFVVSSDWSAPVTEIKPKNDPSK